jgi:glutathione synthase/RimK-type ligase-like ATP-grasp enzyme
MNFLLRRRKLGRTSTTKIGEYSKNKIGVVLNEVDKQPREAGVVFRWGCTATIEPNKCLVVNKAKAIHAVTDKAGFRKLLSSKNLAVPSWTHIKDWAKDGSRLPIIVRPTTHHQGRHLYFCKSERELLSQVAKMGSGYYLSEFFPKSEEFRVFVVQGRVVCVASKTPGNPQDIAWNVAQGGHFDNVKWGDWDIKACLMSIEAMNLADLDFGGVDIMKDKRGNLSILEINSAPSLTSEYRQQCFAKAFDYIVENKSCANIPLRSLRPDQYRWRNVIHPAISSESA